MTPVSAARAVRYGHALASAIRAFAVLEADAGWFERLLIRLLRAAYRQRLRHLVVTLPAEVTERFLVEENKNTPD